MLASWELVEGAVEELFGAESLSTQAIICPVVYSSVGDVILSQT